MAATEQEAEGPNIRVLKAVVIGLGVLIVIGVAVIIATVILRLGRMSAEPVEKRIELPKGAEIIDMVPAGDRFAFRLRLEDGSQRVIVIDPRSLSQIGRLDIGAGR